MKQNDVKIKGSLTERERERDVMFQRGYIIYENINYSIIVQRVSINVDEKLFEKEEQ